MGKINEHEFLREIGNSFRGAQTEEGAAIEVGTILRKFETAYGLQSGTLKPVSWDYKINADCFEIKIAKNQILQVTADSVTFITDGIRYVYPRQEQ